MLNYLFVFIFVFLLVFILEVESGGKFTKLNMRISVYQFSVCSLHDLICILVL